jgi:hypothetical protein
MFHNSLTTWGDETLSTHINQSRTAKVLGLRRLHYLNRHWSHWLRSTMLWGGGRGLMIIVGFFFGGWGDLVFWDKVSPYPRLDSNSWLPYLNLLSVLDYRHVPPCLVSWLLLIDFFLTQT